MGNPRLRAGPIAFVVVGVTAARSLSSLRLAVALRVTARPLPADSPSASAAAARPGTPWPPRRGMSPPTRGTDRRPGSGRGPAAGPAAAAAVERVASAADVAADQVGVAALKGRRGRARGEPGSGSGTPARSARSAPRSARRAGRARPSQSAPAARGLAPGGVLAGRRARRVGDRLLAEQHERPLRAAARRPTRRCSSSRSSPPTCTVPAARASC